MTSIPFDVKVIIDWDRYNGIIEMFEEYSIIAKEYNGFLNWHQILYSTAGWTVDFEHEEDAVIFRLRTGM